MIVQEYAQKLYGILADAIGVEASKLVVGNIKSRDYGLPVCKHLDITFLVNGQKRAMVDIGADDGLLHSVYLTLPPSVLPPEKTYASFSLSVLQGLTVELVTATYDTKKHQEFKELLKYLRENKRIPREWISRGREPSIYPTYGAATIGHIFGTPVSDRLCIQVDKEHLKYVPEAEMQIDQGHACMHRETIPYNPFETNPDDAPQLSLIALSLISSNFSADRFSRWLKRSSMSIGDKHLEEFLEGLPVPADGIEIAVEHKEYGGMVTINSSFIEIRLKPPIQNMYKPLTIEDIKRQVALARSLEAMFK